MNESTRRKLDELAQIANRIRGMRARNDPRALQATNDLADAKDAIIAREEGVTAAWVDQLYEVRAEPDKLLIMITNKHYEIHRIPERPVPERPRVVCLCGSTRFMEEFQLANLRETVAGRIVLSIGCNTKSDADLAELGELTDAVKASLDELHKRKIDMSDEILVLNVGGYIGPSTQSEILYAYTHGKGVRYLEAVVGNKAEPEFKPQYLGRPVPVEQGHLQDRIGLRRGYDRGDLTAIEGRR